MVKSSSKGKQKKEEGKYEEDMNESEIEQQQAPLVIDLDDLKHQFNKLDPKTISLSKNTMEHINSTLTFLTCENATLQQQISKMQGELEEAHCIRGEIQGDFERIRTKVEMA